MQAGGYSGLVGAAASLLVLSAEDSALIADREAADAAVRAAMAFHKAAAKAVDAASRPAPIAKATASGATRYAAKTHDKLLFEAFKGRVPDKKRKAALAQELGIDVQAISRFVKKHASEGGGKLSSA